MMARWIPEWWGKTDDTPAPPRVRLRIYNKYVTYENGRSLARCPDCSRELEEDKWDLDHIVALINGGQNRESNLWPVCHSPCHSRKTAKDVAEKSKIARKRRKYLGIKGRKRTIGGRKFNGDPIRPRYVR